MSVIQLLGAGKQVLQILIPHKTCRREVCIAAMYFWPWLVHTPCWRKAYEALAWIYGYITLRETADVVVISRGFPNNLFRHWKHIFSTIFIKNSQLFIFTSHPFNNKFKHPNFDFLFHNFFQLFEKRSSVKSYSCLQRTLFFLSLLE